MTSRRETRTEDPHRIDVEWTFESDVERENRSLREILAMRTEVVNRLVKQKVERDETIAKARDRVEEFVTRVGVTPVPGTPAGDLVIDLRTILCERTYPDPPSLRHEGP